MQAMQSGQKLIMQESITMGKNIIAVDFVKKEKLKTAFKLECLSDRNWRNRRLLNLIYRNMQPALTKSGKDIYYHPWVAELTGFSDKFNFERKFIKGAKDYSDANSSGTKGVYMYFFLDNNKIYECCRYLSFLEKERFFIKVEKGKIERIKPEEVIEWLEKNQ